MSSVSLEKNTQISNSEMQLIQAFSEQKVIGIEPEKLETSLADIIEKVYADAGQKLDALFISVLSADIMSDVKNYFGGLTIKEIEIACTRGVLGEYGEYFGINRKSIFGWLTSYRSSAERLNAKKKLEEMNKPKELPKPELTKQQLSERAFNMINEYVAKHNKLPEIFPDYILVYNHLYWTGQVRWKDEDEKEMFTDMVKNLIQTESDAFKLKGNIHKSKEILNQSKPGEDFDARCKVEFVKSYFKQKLK